MTVSEQLLAAIDKTRATKPQKLEIVHTQGPTSYNTFAEINKLFPDHLECLGVIRASLSECHNVALLEVGRGAGSAGVATAAPPRRCIIL